MSLSAHVHRDPLAEAHLHRFAKHAAEGTLPEWMSRFHGGKAADVAACWSAAWLEIFAADWDVVPALSGIAGPLLALHGAKDAYGVPEQLENIARAVPHADARLLPDIDHFPHLEDPAGTDAAIAAFLSDALGL